MILTFVCIMLGFFFVIRPLQKNVFYMLYFAFMCGAAYVLEYKGFHVALFSKRALMMFVLCHIIFINFVTFLAYGVDKRAAKKQHYRVPEVQLHLLEFLGGSPAAIVAQRVFHHKTKKKSYQLSFIFVLAVQIVVVWYVLKSFHFL